MWRVNMKTYSVEVVKIKKEYVRITVDAETRKQAIEVARATKEEDFEEHETRTQTEWTAKRNWNWNILEYLLG